VILREALEQVLKKAMRTVAWAAGADLSKESGCFPLLRDITANDILNHFCAETNLQNLDRSNILMLVVVMEKLLLQTGSKA